MICFCASFTTCLVVRDWSTTASAKHHRPHSCVVPGQHPLHPEVWWCALLCIFGLCMLLRVLCADNRRVCLKRCLLLLPLLLPVLCYGVTEQLFKKGCCFLPSDSLALTVMSHIECRHCSVPPSDVQAVRPSVDQPRRRAALHGHSARPAFLACVNAKHLQLCVIRQAWAVLGTRAQL